LGRIEVLIDGSRTIGTTGINPLGIEEEVEGIGFVKTSYNLFLDAGTFFVLNYF